MKERTPRVWLAFAVLVASLGVGATARAEKEAEAPYRGVWTARRSLWNVQGSGPTVLVQLQFQVQRRDGHSSHSAAVPIGRLAGLDATQAESSAGLVKFGLDRDAGSFALEGSFAHGEGAGHFAFTPSVAYRSELEKLGYGSASDSELFTLATQDVGRTFIRDLASLGYARLKLDDLTSLAIHGATPSFIRELRELGYTGLAVNDLVSMRIHGATPEFIRELRALGYAGVPVDDLVAMRIHGVTADYVRSVNRRGQAPTVAKLVEMRIHGDDEDP